MDHGSTEPDGNPGQWYLHLFDAEQPDLNWDNPEVFDDFEKTLRFWLDRGVDGFRIDVAHGMAKPPGLPDMKNPNIGMLRLDDNDPRFNHDGVHDIHRGSARCSTTTRTRSRSARCGCSTTSSSPSTCGPTSCTWASTSGCCAPSSTRPRSATRSTNSLAAAAIVDATPTWTLANHDVEREVTRYGGGEVGLARARAMALVMLALPGTVFIYNGEELGLPNVELPDEALQDPVWFRSGGRERGRDGVRVPMPWEGDEPPFGFSDTADTWLPIPPQWARLTVERQLRDPDSTLNFWRRALRLRHKRPESGTDVRMAGRAGRRGDLPGGRRAGVRAERRR